MLDRRVSPNCLGTKCVVRTRIMSSHGYALRLLFSTEFTAQRLRDIAPLSPALGKKLPVLLRRLLPEVIERVATGDPAEPVDRVLAGYPREILRHVRTRIIEVLADPLGYVESVHRSGLRPEVGWAVVEESPEAMLLEPEWVWYMIDYLSSVAADARTDIALCGARECYPLPLGLYPTRQLIGLAHDTGQLPLLYERLRDRYGYTTIAEALDFIEPEKAAIVVQPKKTRLRASIFLKVADPAGTAETLARLQQDALTLEEELLRARLGAGGAPLVEEHKLTTIIEEVLREEGVL